MCAILQRRPFVSIPSDLSLKCHRSSLCLVTAPGNFCFEIYRSLSSIAYIDLSGGIGILPIVLKEVLELKRRIFALREDDIEKILRVTQVEKQRSLHTAPRNKLLIRLLIVTGLRASELANLRIEDIDLENGSIYVWSGKGGKQRIVLVDPETVQMLRIYCRSRDSKSNLLGLRPRMIAYIVRRYAIAAGVRWAEYVSPHRLRDTFAVHWIRNQGDIESLRRLLGHASLQNTQKYLVFDFDEVKATYDRIFAKKEKRLYE